MKFEKGATEFLEYKKSYIKFRTYERYISLIPRITQFFGNIDIEKISTKDLQTFIKWLSEEKKLSNSSIKIHIMFLKSVICYFDADKKFNKLFFPKEKKKNIKVYTDEEIVKIKKYIFEEDHLQNCLGELIAIYTGMRLGEILALQWSDIHFNEGFINVSKSIYRRKNEGMIIASPKALASYRQIPLHPKLKEVLRKFRSHCVSDYVVGANEGKKIKSFRTLQAHNEKMCEKIGVESKGMHAYRHYFATHLIKRTNQVKLVSECLGHSNILITQNIYNNPSLDDKKKMLEFLE